MASPNPNKVIPINTIKNQRFTPKPGLNHRRSSRRLFLILSIKEECSREKDNRQSMPAQPGHLSN
jgi:hypothetical protein